MTYILNAGGERDSAAIQLATKLGTYIRNERRFETSPLALRASQELFQHEYPEAILRSLTATYNCMGLVFASRRTWVDTDELKLILEEDNYHRVDDEQDVMPGDIIVYKDDENRVVHVGVILQVDVDLTSATRRFKVLSKWGADGEYMHEARYVPRLFGAPADYFSERSSAQ